MNSKSGRYFMILLISFSFITLVKFLIFPSSDAELELDSSLAAQLIVQGKFCNEFVQFNLDAIYGRYDFEPNVSEEFENRLNEKLTSETSRFSQLNPTETLQECEHIKSQILEKINIWNGF